MRNLFLMVKIHLDEEFRISTFFHEKNPVKRMGFVMKNIVLLCMLAALAGMSYLSGQQMVANGFGEAIPLIGYVVGNLISLIATVLKINDILAGNSDAEFLMSLPMGTFLHVICIFLRIYVWDTLLVALTNVPMILAYQAGGMVVPGFWKSWIFGLLFTCMPVTGLATLLGTVLALCLSTVRRSNLVQSIITLCVLAFVGILLLKTVYSAGKVLDSAGDVQSLLDTIMINYKGGRFYQLGVIEHSFGYFCLFMLYSCICFLFFLFVLSMGYEEVIIALSSPKSFIVYQYGIQKEKTMAKAISKRLWDQWLQSRSYMTSTLIGPLYAVMISVFLWITGGNGLVEMLADGAKIHYMAIPFFLCVLIGMGCNTYCGLSMERRCHWVMQVMPLDTREICIQKVKMNLWITEPVSVLCGVLLVLAIKPPMAIGWTYIVLPCLYAVLSALWGMRTDVKHADYSLDSENQVLRQSISFYLGWIPVVILPLLLGAVTCCI